MGLSVLIDATLDVKVERGGELALCVGVSSPRLTEALVAVGPGGYWLEIAEVLSDGGRIQVIDAPEGNLRVTYQAEVWLQVGEPEEVDALSALVYRRPSRYCPSDQVAGLEQ